MLSNDNLYRRIEGMLYIYPKVKAEIENIKIDIEELNDVLGIKGANNNQIKPSTATYSFNSNVENEVIDREESIPEKTLHLQRTIRSKERFVRKVDVALGTLNDDNRKLIELKYFKGISANDLANRYGIEPITFYKRKAMIIKGLMGLL